MKIRRIDLYPDDFLVGTVGLSDADVGVYFRICLLIYSSGKSITEELIRRVSPSHGNALFASLDRLEKLGKIIRNGREIDQKRCRNELERSEKRIGNKLENLAKRRKINGIPAPIVYNNQQSTTNSQQSTIKETRASRASSNEGFDRWWEGYPDKVGKGAARKAFTKALSKTSLDQLIDGVRRYKATKPADRPWCNPATWLNQERWLDVPATNGHAPESTALPFGGPPTGPPPIPEGGFFRVDRADAQ